MDKILDDIKQLIHDGDVDQVLEFAEMIMVQNKQLISDNSQLVNQCKVFMKDFEPEPEPEPELEEVPEPHPVFEKHKGTEKIEYTEGMTEDKFFQARSAD